MAWTKKQSEALREKKKKGRNKRYAAIAYAYLRISRDIPKPEIIEGLMEKYEYAESTARHIYEKGYNRYQNQLVKDSVEVTNRNLKTLEGLIDASVEDADSKTILAAIDMQNKMLGAYETKVNVKSEGEGAIFKIKIDE